MGPSLGLLEQLLCFLNRPFDQPLCLGERGLVIKWWNSHSSEKSENSAPAIWGLLFDTTFSGMSNLVNMAFILLIIARLVVLDIFTDSKYLLW